MPSGPRFADGVLRHPPGMEKLMPRTASTDTAQAATRTTPAPDAINLLMEDHRAVQKLFNAFDKADRHDLDARATLVRRACEELTVHAMIEEEVFYPAAQKALDEEDRPEVEEAFVEHYLVKILIERFATLKAGEPGFDATFKVMSEMVRHHIEEEESDLFPRLRKSGADMAQLGEKLMQRKKTLEARIPKDAGDNTLRLH